MIKTLFSLLLTIFLFACQSDPVQLSPQTSVNTNLYLDEKFDSDNAIRIETEAEIFALDDDMRNMVHEKLLNQLTAQQKARVLLEHLFDEENIALSYDGNANITARQAYHSKSANCMSLTILAYALAEEAGMNISFQEVDVPEYWVSNGRYSLLTGHVNLLVKESKAVNRRIIWGEKATQIDFDPYVSKKDFPAKVIKKHTLLAMFYNNKGAEALVNNNFYKAYQYIKVATETDPLFAAAWGNLGVLYKLTGDYQMAESVYRKAISLDEDNLNALGNLALLFNKQGRNNEAQPIEDYLYKLRIRNPYYHALLGSEAFIKRSYQASIKHYKKAIQLDDEQHEFYFGLAKAYYKQNNFTLAKRSLTKAVALTKAKDTQRQYVAKLNFLKDRNISNH